jgi:DNA topoisomerase-3
VSRISPQPSDRADQSAGPCQFPTLGFVVDQYNRVQAFNPETFWYIYVAINRLDNEDESEGQDPETRLVEFKWRRNHLFDIEAAIVIFEQCATNPLATVTKVETKLTQKWYGSCAWDFVSRLG